MKKGEGGSAVQGSAGPGGAQNAASDLERCDKPMATIAVVEPQAHVIAHLARYKLASPSGLIRLMIQQSNCFLVVERGVGMQNLMQERALQKAGELRQDSNVGGGQMVTADYVLTPSVVFSEDNAGGVGGGVGAAIGGLFGSGGRAIGAVAGGLKFKEAQTSMLVADARSSIQVAAAEGSAQQGRFPPGRAVRGRRRGAAGAIGARRLREHQRGQGPRRELRRQLQRHRAGRPRQSGPAAPDVASLQGAEAGAPTKAGSVFNEGDVLRPKIANVKLLSKPSDESAMIVTLAKGEELIFMGKEQDGFVSVETSKGSGWVKKVLVTR